LIIVILGVLVGGLVIAMYLPIFKLGSVLVSDQRTPPRGLESAALRAAFSLESQR